jgi:hypothetical protein
MCEANKCSPLVIDYSGELSYSGCQTKVVFNCMGAQIALGVVEEFGRLRVEMFCSQTRPGNGFDISHIPVASKPVMVDALIFKKAE